MKKIAIMAVFFATVQLFWGALLYAGEDQANIMQSAFRSSDLVGKAVENHNQVKLGVVEDLVIGPDGRVNYVVISHNEMQEMNVKLTPIPFSAIDKNAGGKGKIVINVEKNEFTNAPGFAENQWPDFSKSLYGEKLHGYHEPNSMDREVKKTEDRQYLREIPSAPFGIPF